MICPICNSGTKVTDSRKRKGGKETYRRRECCLGHKFASLEKAVMNMDFERDIIMRLKKLEAKV